MPVSAFTYRRANRTASGTARGSKQLLAGAVVVWLGCASQATARTPETRHSNWMSNDAPCAKYDDLRKPVLGDIGVKIDATGPWADGFRRALSLWNTVLAANFHEETELDACAIRIINAGPGLLSNSMVARSQLTEWDDFRGKIAVSPEAANALSGAEMYATAVHEIGHMLGLKHNASSQSVMYFFNVNGTEVLDQTDILDLSTRHKLRLAPASSQSVKVDLTAVPIPTSSGSDLSAEGRAESPAYLDGRMHADAH